MTTTVTAPITTQYCTFWADGLFFGVAVSDVQEVLRYQDMTVVPRATDAVQGLINLRGQIVTAVDLRRRLGLTVRPEDQLPMNVVIRSRDEVVSLLVDDIGDVLDTDGAQLQPPPATLPATVRDVTIGVITLPASILLVLDADLAADIPTARTNGGIQ